MSIAVRLDVLGNTVEVEGIAYLPALPATETIPARHASIYVVNKVQVVAGPRDGETMTADLLYRLLSKQDGVEEKVAKLLVEYLLIESVEAD